MRNIKDIKVVLLQHYINFFDKKFALLADKSASGNAIKIVNISKKKKKKKKKKQKNYTIQLLETLRKEKYTHLL